MDNSGKFKVDNVYVLKEKTMNCMELTFKVHNDIVYGLKFCVFLKKHGVNVGKDEEVIGCFSPTTQEYVVQLSPERVPDGFFQRGTYQGKAILADLDGNVHMQYEFTFKIDKEW